MFFRFYDLLVTVLCNDLQLIERLGRDFSYFKIDQISESDKINQLPFLKVNLTLGTLPKDDFSKSKLRFLNYDNKLLAWIDFSKEEGDFYSEDLHLLHEIAYLFILTRVGKRLEKKGFYKIHASALRDELGVILCPMLMKGGKTTLFLGLLCQKNFQIFSDDAPLVDKRGRVLPFPIRIGMEKKETYTCFSQEDIYVLKRRRFGLKYLVDVRSIKNSIASSSEGTLTFWLCKRVTRPGCSLHKISRLRLIPLIFINMILGLGLPYAREFYLEGTLKDFLTLIKTGWGRSKAAFHLLKKAECYFVILGNVPLENAKYLASLRSEDGRQNNEGRN